MYLGYQQVQVYLGLGAAHKKDAFSTAPGVGKHVSCHPACLAQLLEPHAMRAVRCAGLAALAAKHCMRTSDHPFPGPGQGAVADRE